MSDIHDMYYENEPRFTFEEVMAMIEKVLAKQNRSGASAMASLKRVNFDEIAAFGHSVKSCKDLLEELVHNTRRVRTLKEVLTDIKDNLKKNRYTEIIARASYHGDVPKKPPSAYLLYHADRYKELRNENHLAVEISKIVAEEWKNLSDKKKRHYQRKHDEMVATYETEMQESGLIDEAAPRRPRSAKCLFIEHHMKGLDINDFTREDLVQMKDRLGQTYDTLAPDQKQQWVDYHHELQERYLREREAYIAAHPHLSHQQATTKKRALDKLNIPEPPRTAVKFYIARKLPEDLEGEALDEAVKNLKDKFSNLKERKQLKYIKKAVQDKERYDREVEEHNRKHPDRPLPKSKPNLTKEQLKIYTRVVENRPELPAPTAYLHYCGKVLSDMNSNEDQQVPTKRMKLASEKWRKANVKEKKAATRQHIEDMTRYVEEMSRWLSQQTEERKMQLLSEEPKANPEFWRKKLLRMQKKAVRDDRV